MLYTLAKSLHSDLKIRVTVVLFNHGTLEQKLRDCGITTYVLDESQLSGFQLLKQLNKIIKNIQPDVIHTHRTKENIIGSISARCNGISSLRTTHGAPEHRPPLHKLAKHLVRLLDWLAGRYYQQNIVAVSPELALVLERDFPQTKIKVIANGIDIDSHTRKNTPDHNIDKDHHIGIIGRLVPVKRVDLFIDSALRLKQQYPEMPVHFHIFGDGPLHAELQTQIQSQQADHFIHLEGHSENIKDDLQTLDALVMISDHEGLPMVLLEAMCLGVPIIAHAVGGIPHLLDQGQCGVLIHSQNTNEFANAIADSINQPERCQRLAQSALKHVHQHYSAKSTASAYLKAYKNIAIKQ